MARILLGLGLLLIVGTGGYFLGARRAQTVPEVVSRQTTANSSELLPLEDFPASNVETLDPVMFKVIENHFKDQADWKLEQ